MKSGNRDEACETSLGKIFPTAAVYRSDFSQWCIILIPFEVAQSLDMNSVPWPQTFALSVDVFSPFNVPFDVTNVKSIMIHVEV